MAKAIALLPFVNFNAGIPTAPSTAERHKYFGLSCGPPRCTAQSER
jgi:hypothetical protein